MTDMPPIRLASTAIALRADSGDMEVLMVRRNPDMAFGGMWTFPGGAIDPDDGPIPAIIDESDHDWADDALVATAANAAVRETREETALICGPEDLTWFSHWIPPRRPGLKRFATWFFVTDRLTGHLELDLRENSAARWIRPADALEEQAGGDFPLAVPTWVTLEDLARHDSPAAVRTDAAGGVRIHHTRLIRGAQGPVLTWIGDAAYESGDLDAEGGRNRAGIGADAQIAWRQSSA